jgi:hypothetical protein
MDDFEERIIQREKDASEHFKVIQRRMPHIAREVEKKWGSAALNNYIAAMMFDTRGDTRAGFPKDIVDALLAISRANEYDHPVLHRLRLEALGDGHGPIWGRDTYRR